ncbi:FliI/YscN family ATPase [Photobacterium leiognathi]|uniref:FliI/YscN family ATPase n=1 Tax=Photobacterium leiognathi TaxID=553611 RepID=UPI00298134CF|nr:FliI/YscN family ATPase [Photobacterium leiognathi]
MQSSNWIHSLLEGTEKELCVKQFGCVTSISGCFVEASYRQCVVGEVALIHSGVKMVECEVVSIKKDTCLLAPLSTLDGVGVGDSVEYKEQLPSIKRMTNPFGKILDGFGEEVSDSIASNELIKESLLLISQPVSVFLKVPVKEKISTGSRIVDDILPLGLGQKVGIFAGSGVGKSTLLNKLHRSIDADVKIVAMVGERSREVVDFYQKQMDSGLSKDTILVASTSEDPPSLKRRAVYVALAYAKYYCEQGLNVVVILDSITRLAHALREIGISRYEPPVARGYPPSVFAELPRIVEQCGNFKGKGSITGIMSVLVDGDDENEPVSDFMRGVLDGHFILDRKLANTGLYPSINMLRSRSRIIENVLNKEQLFFEKKVRQIYSEYSEIEDVVRTGIYQEGTSDDIDYVVKLKKQLDVELYSWKESVDKELVKDVLAFKENNTS